MSHDEIARIGDGEWIADEVRRLGRSAWGRCRFEPGPEETFHLVIYDEEDRELTYMPLHQSHSSAQVLDWIMQVASKQWATDDVIADFVRAIKETIHPQSNLCSGGTERPDSAGIEHRLKIRASAMRLRDIELEGKQ